jgi:hypothetical protein
LFWNDGKVWADRIRIVVEMIAGGLIVDDLGRGTCEPNVMMRYEIELGFNGGLRLINERLAIVGSADTSKAIAFPYHPSVVSVLGLSEDDRDEQVIFDLAANLMPGGEAVPKLDAARKTMLNHYRTIEHYDVLVAGNAIRNWRRLGLEPDELRKPYALESDARGLGRSGEYLPLRFMHLMNPGYPQVDLSDLGEDPDALSAEIVAKLAPIASLRKIWVDEDAERGLLTLRATLQSGEEVSARGLSDGTLRYLALILLGGGTLRYIEEPENGIHPLRFAELADLLRGLATDLSEDITADLEDLDKYDVIPLRQVIVNTHSSELVREIFKQSPGDLLMATTALISGPEQHSARVLRLHPIRNTWRCRGGERGVMLPVYNYLDAAALDAATTEES